MLKSNIDVFFVTSFLCSLQFLLFHRIEYPKRCIWKKKWNFSMAQFLYRTVPVTLTFDLWKSIEYNPISILCKFQIDISSNSREIKYQNIGRTHRHTDRHTDTRTHRHTDRQTDRVKTIPRNPLRGEVINFIYPSIANELITSSGFSNYLNVAFTTRPCKVIY